MSANRKPQDHAAKQADADAARRVALAAAATAVEPIGPGADLDQLAEHAQLIVDLAWLLEPFSKSGIRDVDIPGRLRDRHTA